MSRIHRWLRSVYRKKDWLWTIIWLAGLTALWIWDSLFLNAPALKQLRTGFLNTMLIALMVILFAALLGR